MRKISLSPTLFSILEFLILLPSLLFIVGVLEWYINRTGFLIFTLIGTNNLIKAALVTVILPFAGGFLAYNYLERYKLKGFIKALTKVILAYTIIEVGLVIIMSILIYFRM